MINQHQNQNKRLNTVLSMASRAYDTFWGMEKPPSEKEQLMADIKLTKKRLECINSLFNHTTDTNMIDLASYDLLAEQARYSSLLKAAKEKGLHV